ncbi:MAG TPA: sensor domain-containing diguanylate cyclase [Candidatus Limnocylindrales bacterium]|nr:sensor domain-containing diguanylate cyclase [Candidatus Limnocylindrales bacterium]
MAHPPEPPRPAATVGPSLTEDGARFDDLVRTLNAVVWEADGDDYRMTFVSPRCADLTGYSPDEWAAEPAFWERNLHPEDRDRAIAATDAAIQEMRTVSLEYRFRTASGAYRWFSDVIAVVPKRDGTGHRLVGVMIDVTDRKRLEEELAFRASHDPLTGLLNREQLDVELARTQYRDGRALLFFDLDAFKDINDGMGHRVGDELLRIVASRLRAGVRDGDIVARFGGDEFAVIVHAASEGEARRLAIRLTKRISAPADLDGRVVAIRASAGIAMAGRGITAEDLLRQADIAMYEAKLHPDHVAVFHPEMRRNALRRLARHASAGEPLEATDVGRPGPPAVDRRRAG